MSCLLSSVLVPAVAVFSKLIFVLWSFVVPTASVHFVYNHCTSLSSLIILECIWWFRTTPRMFVLAVYMLMFMLFQGCSYLISYLTMIAICLWSSFTVANSSSWVLHYDLLYLGCKWLRFNHLWRLSWNVTSLFSIYSSAIRSCHLNLGTLDTGQATCLILMLADVICLLLDCWLLRLFYKLYKSKSRRS